MRDQGTETDPRSSISTKPMSMSTVTSAFTPRTIAALGKTRYRLAG